MPLTLSQVEARFQQLETREDAVRSYFRPLKVDLTQSERGVVGTQRHRFAEVLEEDPFANRVKKNRELRRKAFSANAQAVGLLPR